MTQNLPAIFGDVEDDAAYEISGKTLKRLELRLRQLEVIGAKITDAGQLVNGVAGNTLFDQGVRPLEVITLTDGQFTLARSNAGGNFHMGGDMSEVPVTYQGQRLRSEPEIQANGGYTEIWLRVEIEPTTSLSGDQYVVSGGVLVGGSVDLVTSGKGARFPVFNREDGSVSKSGIWLFKVAEVRWTAATGYDVGQYRYGPVTLQFCTEGDVSLAWTPAVHVTLIMEREDG